MIQAKLMSAVAILAVLSLLFGAGWHYGSASTQARWYAERDASATRVAALQLELAEASAAVITQYVDRVQIVRERGLTITKEIPIYVTSDACYLPGGFRVLHDAAASATLPDPASVIDAAPVAASVVAKTVAENYDRCEQNAEQLKALQQLLITQRGNGNAI